MSKFINLEAADTFQVIYHIADGRVYYDAENWKELKKVTTDDIEALEVIESLLGAKARELVTIIASTESTVLGDLEKANELNNDKTLSNAIKRKQRADEILTMDVNYTQAKSDLEVLNFEISKINRKIRALTRVFIAEYKNFTSKI